MENFLEQYGYVALLVGTFFEGETAILVASSLIHQGIFDAFPTVIVGFAGSFISDWVYYLVGRLNGKYFLDKRPKVAAKVEPVRSLFRRHQTQILFSYRFLYGFRVIIPIVIGMSHVTPIRSISLPGKIRSALSTMQKPIKKSVNSNTIHRAGELRMTAKTLS